MGYIESRMQDNARLQNSIAGLGSALAGNGQGSINRQRAQMIAEQQRQMQRKNSIEDTINYEFQDAIVVDPQTGIPHLDVKKAGRIMGLMKASNPEASLDDLTKMMQGAALKAWELKSDIIKKGLDPVAQGSMRAPITGSQAEAIMGNGSPQVAPQTNMAPIEADNASRERIAQGNNQTQQNIATQGNAASQTLQDTKPTILPQGSMMIPGRADRPLTGQLGATDGIGTLINKKQLPDTAKKQIEEKQNAINKIDRLSQLIDQNPDAFSYLNRAKSVLPSFTHDLPLIGVDPKTRETWENMQDLRTQIGHDLYGSAGINYAVVDQMAPGPMMNQETAKRRTEMARTKAEEPLKNIENAYQEYDIPQGSIIPKKPSMGAPVPQSGGQPPAPKTEQEYNSIPSGTQYLHPSGELRIKG